MSRLRSLFAGIAAVVLPALGAQAAVISASFAANQSTMGTGNAGFVPATNWNNIPDNTGAGGSTVLALVNDSGVATTAKLVITQSNAAGGTSPTFTDPDNNAMFGGHSWISGNPITVTVTAVPYAQYDVYAYFRSGQIPFDHPQLFTIYDNVTNVSLGSQEGLEPASPGTATRSTFVQSTGSGANLTFGNYVKFTNVNVTDFRLNLTVENTYTYINGLQIVQTPEPTSLATLALGAAGLLARRRKA